MFPKRLILVSVAILVGSVLAGCATNNNNNNTNTTPTGTTPSGNNYAAKVFGSEGLFNAAGPAQDKDIATKAGCSSGSPPCADGKWLAANLKGTNPSSGNLSTFNAKFQAAYGHAPAQYAAESYDAVMYIALAALKAQSVKGSDIKGHMLEVANAPGTPCNTWATCSTAIIAGSDIDYQGMASDFTYDANHEPTSGMYDVWQIQSDGSTKIVETGRMAGGSSGSNTTPSTPNPGTPGTPITPKALTLKLGEMNPLTGALNSLGPDMQNGAELAVADINAATTTTQLTVQSFKEDDKTSDTTAITSTFDKLVGEGVTAIEGPCCSGVTGAVLSKAIQNQVVIASPSATSPKLTVGQSDPTNGGYFWRVSPNDGLQGKVLADVVKGGSISTVAIIYVNNAYGSGLIDPFKAEFGSSGIKGDPIAYNEQNTGDFSSQVTTACATKADAIVIFGYITDGANILKEMQKQGCLGK